MGLTHRTRHRRIAIVLALTISAAACSSSVAGQAVRGEGSPAVTGTSGAAITSATPSVPEPSDTNSSSPAAATTSPSPSSTEQPVEDVMGSEGIGDLYYPQAGNGGYDVINYDVSLHYDPAIGELDATTQIMLQALPDTALDQFNVDLQPNLTVSQVTVAGDIAEFDHRGAELIITPAAAVPAAATAVVVDYHGIPGLIAGGTSSLGDGGWYRTASGGAVATGEPFSASAWFPSNDHPADTASFTVTATVPLDWDVVSTGERVTDNLPTAPAGMHTVRYQQHQPVATYLTTVMIDKLTFTYDTFDGLLIANAFTPRGEDSQNLAAVTGDVMEVLGGYFGPFPFSSYGGIYTGEPIPFALETAGRPVYASWVDLDTLIHETAHQWFGNSVTIERWADICLNECFASYAPWLYAESVNHTDLDALWHRQLADALRHPDQWAIPLIDPGAGNEFVSVYWRGPLAIHALRHEMGEAAFIELLRSWPEHYRGSNVTFDMFETFANELAGKDLTAFFDAWFRGTEAPPEKLRFPGTLK